MQVEPKSTVCSSQTDHQNNDALPAPATCHSQKENSREKEATSSKANSMAPSQSAQSQKDSTLKPAVKPKAAKKLDLAAKQELLVCTFF